ncbi:hypothetical protein D3OALGB2SA_4543 [Olavius algarvensis associated proteobacterium Delta 3]|nr:hypothetical protein D3OALGB2SA_4543 [Olavius algarvensis associated proteobacterium Delta 3]
MRWRFRRDEGKRFYNDFQNSVPKPDSRSRVWMFLWIVNALIDPLLTFGPPYRTLPGQTAIGNKEFNR